MTDNERAPRARFTRRLVFHETEEVVDRLVEWADEAGTSQASIVRMALRRLFEHYDPPEAKAGA